MGLTSGQALEILGKAVSINERIRTLLKNCADDEMYDEVNDIRSFLFDTYFEEPITADVGIVFSLTEGVEEITEQIAKQAQKNNHSAYYLDANRILIDIEELDREIKRQNRR